MGAVLGRPSLAGSFLHRTLGALPESLHPFPRLSHAESPRPPVELPCFRGIAANAQSPELREDVGIEGFGQQEGRTGVAARKSVLEKETGAAHVPLAEELVGAGNEAILGLDGLGCS